VASCTLFSIAADEIAASPEPSLPDYDSRSAMTQLDASSTLELGTRWRALHASLGGHGGAHPLAFLESGGEELPAFAGAGASGRYFTPIQVLDTLIALARITSPSRDIERVRVFVADVAASGRGLVVYRFGDATRT
jgi:hypothetical protein